ncbi:14192_t:CDS:2, partial [Racocetra persica]
RNQDIDNLIKATYKNQHKFILEWISFNDFTDITKIGTGGFSEIYTAIWTKGEITGWNTTKNEVNRSENLTIVLKVLKDSQNINSAFLKELQNIVKSQPNTYGRNLIKCYGVSQDPKTNDYIFVMPYMSNGSLNDYLSNNFKDITWKMKRDFLRNIVTGIKWIHENKIIHRDIHDGNILIGKLTMTGSAPTLLIADLGFSRPAKDDLEKAENKRKELLKSGQFIAKYMHPCSKTHSKLLNPTIDSVLSVLFQTSRSFASSSIDSFQNVSSYSFNTVLCNPEFLKNADNLNSTANPSNLRKHTIEDNNKD